MSQYQPPSPFPSGEQPQWDQQPSQPFPPQQPNTQWGQPPQYQPQWQEQPGYSQQQPYQQPYQPPYQQPYQPPFQPPKKKSRKGLWIALAIVAAVLIFGCVGIVALVSAGGHAVQNAANQASTEIATAATGLPTSQATSAPTQPTSQQNAAGKPIVASDIWTVTLNSAATSTGTDFITPKSGNIFLEVDVTLKNTSSSSQTASSLLMFSLIDGTGQKYDESFGVKTTPDGAVAAGGLLRGTVTFEVPKSVHTFTLQFQPDITSSTIVQWTVKD